MRRRVAIVAALAAAVWAPAAAGAGSAPPQLGFTLEGVPLFCGHPHGSFAVTFPSGTLPARIARRTVSLGAFHPAAVSVSGRTLVLASPLQTGVTCQSIALGPLRVTIAPAAHLRLGARRTLALTVRHGARVYRVRATVG